MAKPKLRPIGDKILVRLVKPKQVAGLIHLPEVAREKPQDAEVVALGTAEFQVKVGDKVHVNKHGGTEVLINGEAYIILREKDVLCVYT